MEMLERYWPSQRGIGGTFRPRRGIGRKWHGLRYRIAARLPRELRPIMGATSVFRMGLDCVRHSGWDAFPSIPRTLSDIGNLRAKPVMEAVKCAIAGSRKHMLKVLAVQPLIHVLQSEN